MNNLISSRYSQKIIFTFLSILAVSFVLSLFVMQLAAALLFILWLFEKKDEKKKAFDLITAFILVFGLVRLITIFLSEFPQSSYESLYKEALFYTTAVALPFYLKTLEKKKVIELMMVFILGATVISVIGATRFFIGDVERAQSFSSSYTVFSGYLLTAFTSALFYPKNDKKLSQHIFWAFVYSILFLGLLTSLGRANIAITFLFFLIAIVLRRIPLKQIIILLVIGLLGFGIYSLRPSQAIGERVENITQLSDRDIIWQGAKEILFEHPVFGFGPRTFQQAFPLKEKFADKGIGGWHNDFLQIYFESGIVGLISFLILLYVIIKTSINQIRNKKTDAELKSLSASVLASVIALIFSALVAGFITSVVLSIVFIFLITFLSRIDFEIESVKEKSESNSTVH
ncbi:MAG: O-antigen ligase family protein [Ignavibacterium album]|uniref:O-antigen ligase family protein n=1 Tax=Ignavibacterium album TaxID=591197 RepID=UPI0026EFCC11|nr:O-antigen ligase family protein [Ignavibacterium album]MCX8105247.1 O-antigen ligase family protein [Ignavibacterium album]